MASKASQAATIRATRGISLPARPSGYPLPSYRSCVERTSAPTGPSEGNERRSFSPASVWRRTCFHSSRSSGPVFVSTASLSASLPMSCSSAVRLTRPRSATLRPSRAATASARRATSRAWRPSVESYASISVRSSSPTRSGKTSPRRRWSSRRSSASASAAGPPASSGIIATPKEQCSGSGCPTVSRSTARPTFSISTGASPSSRSANASEPTRKARGTPVAARSRDRRMASPASYPCRVLNARNPSTSATSSTRGAACCCCSSERRASKSSARVPQRESGGFSQAALTAVGG